MRQYLIAVLAILAGAGSAAGQEPGAAELPLVFLDCNARNCDFDHFRREITWASWVRDREDADVHLLVTAQRTGGNGWDYSLDFIGRRPFEGIAKSVSYVSHPDATDAEVREGLTRAIALGMVQFVEATPLAARLAVVFEEAAGPAAQQEQEEDDPWNLWVFRLSVEGELEGESQERGYSGSASASADRVTEDLKININVRGRFSRDEFDLDEDSTVVNTSENYSADWLVVWSLDRHWSAGGRINADRSTFLNRDLAFSAGPTVEYNIFPYEESTRRSITFRYSAEVVAFDYEKLTVEGLLNEVRPRHSLLIAAAVQQPWGEVFGSVEGIQYLDDPATHRINTDLNLEYRLFRGFSLDVRGGVSRIKDQFYLPAEGLSPEEVLLSRRQRETAFSYDISVGFSYRFGSIFANIVNPRMGGGNRGRRRF